MEPRTLYITRSDLTRLQSMIRTARNVGDRDTTYLDRLEDELDHGHVVSAREVRPDIVTMNSRVRLRDPTTGQEGVYSLVFPENTDVSRNQVSVLAPMGVALLGASVGEEVEWETPAGPRHMRVEELLYQPEAAGDYHL